MNWPKLKLLPSFFDKISGESSAKVFDLFSQGAWLNLVNDPTKKDQHYYRKIDSELNSGNVGIVQKTHLNALDLFDGDESKYDKLYLIVLKSQLKMLQF